MSNPKLPFRIDRSSEKTLSQQLTDLLRRGILEGVWTEGGSLPSRAAIAAELVVGENTVRASFRTLESEGLIRLYPRIGAVVLRRRTVRSSGRVLHVSAANMGAYYLSLYASELRNAINAAGFRYAQVGVPTAITGRAAYRPLINELAFKPDICIVETNTESIRSSLKCLDRFGVPYVISSVAPTAERYGKMFLGSICCDQRQALSAFVADCFRMKIHSVCQFNFGVSWNFDARKMLQRGGINVETVNAADGMPLLTPNDYMSAGRRAMMRRLAMGPLPELLLFSDDYLAMGALPCLAERGLRIPADIRVVTLVNVGFEPVLPVSLACIDMDPRVAARRMADAVAAWFRTGRFVSGGPVVSRYVRGGSFPCR